MSKYIEIEYCKDFKCDWRIISPISYIIEMMIIPKEIPITKKTLGNYYKENCVYLLVQESIIKDPIKYFLLDKQKVNEDEINFEYYDEYRKNRHKVYVGKTKDANTRFNPHNKDFMEYTIFIRSRLDNGFTKQECSFIERYFYNKYKDGVLIELDNSISPPGEELSKSEYNKVRSYLDQIEEMLYRVNKNIFDVNRKKYIAESKKGIKAEGYIFDNGITIVTEGSYAAKDNTINANETLKRRREKILDTKVIQLNGDKYIFKKDYIFLSSSGAAETILGYNKNGKKLWHEKKNK